MERRWSGGGCGRSDQAHVVRPALVWLLHSYSFYFFFVGVCVYQRPELFMSCCGSGGSGSGSGGGGDTG